ncbi:hypothetical protein R1flu_027815 [Riccia fluitans]|uniref:MADS-box domain-containing protein n=1 Tax=Riccia fluitans TaxID=41844 RepID=A0ABD1XJW5_9MARC
MGRVKLKIQKIENTSDRHVTYCKRGNGLIKKAYELSVLCDVDIGVIMFSRSGKLREFCSNGRIQQLITRFANTPDYNRPQRTPEKLEKLNRAIRKLNSDQDLEVIGDGEDNLQELAKLQTNLNQAIEEKQFWEKRAKLYPGEQSIQNVNSMIQLDAIESEVQQGLFKLRQHKLEVGAMEDQINTRLQQGYNSFVQQMNMEIGYQEDCNTGKQWNDLPNIDGVQSQGYQFHCFMEQEVNPIQDYIIDPMASSSMTRNITRRDLASTELFCLGPSQTDQLSLVAHENPFQLQNSMEERDVNVFQNVKAEADGQYFQSQYQGQLDSRSGGIIQQDSMESFSNRILYPLE